MVNRTSPSAISINSLRFAATDTVIGTKTQPCSINANNSAIELGEKSASTITIAPFLMPSDIISFFLQFFTYLFY